MQTYESTTIEQPATVTPDDSGVPVKPSKLVPCESTIDECMAAGYELLTDVTPCGNWYDMLGKVLKGQKSAMQVYWPLFDYINSERKYGLHKSGSVDRETVKIATVFEGTAMVNKKATGGARYIVAACGKVPVVERRTLDDKYKAAYKANVAEYKAKNKARK